MIGRPTRRLLFRVLAGACAVASPVLSFTAPVKKIGLSLPLTGGQSEVAIDLLAGYKLGCAAGGSGIQVEVLDDLSSPEKTAANIGRLCGDPDVVAVSGVVGTPHAQASIPVARAAEVPMVGIRSGALFLRDGKPGVYHLRASFEDEISKVLDFLRGALFTELVVVYSNDSFGKSSLDHLVKRAALLGINVRFSQAVDREGGGLPAACDGAAAAIRSAKTAVAVYLLLIAKPMEQAVGLLRSTHKIVYPIFTMSFIGTRSISTNNDPKFIGLGMATAFPLPRGNDRLAMQFRRDATKFNAGDVYESLSAFEGYFYATVISNALRSASSVDRVGLSRSLGRGLSVSQNQIEFDKSVVGFHYLDLVRKNSFNFRFSS